MNILLCASDNNVASGAFLCLVELCKYLKQKKHFEVLIILPSYGTGVRLLEKYHIPYKIIKSFPWIIPFRGNLIKKIKSVVKFLLNIVAVKRIEKVISKYNIDIVHSNSTWTYVGVAAARNCNKKCIWHLREAMELSQEIHIFYPSFYVKKLTNYAQKYIAVSHFIKDYFERKNIANIEVIYDGVDIKQYYDPNRTLFNHDKIRIIMVNAIYPGKRQDELLRALSFLEKKILDKLEIYFVGDYKVDTRYTNTLKQMVKNIGVGNRVQFLGVIHDINKVYKIGDISCICSPFESFGRVAVESMLAGCVVIGCNSGGTREILDDGRNGFIYQSGDSKDLAKKITYCVTHTKEAINKAVRGQQIAYGKFSSELSGEKISALYYKLYKDKK